MECGKYIITDDKRGVGTLRAWQDGLYTLLEASAEPQEGLTRLYVSGGGKSTCIGLMVPEGGLLKLRRRLSKLEMRKLPHIETVSTCPPEKAARAEPPAPEKKPEEQPAAPAEVWRPMPDGSLVLTTAEGRFLALPAKLRRKPPGVRLYVINDQEYLLFHF